MNKYYEILKRINNFGIEEDEILTHEERQKRMSEFRKKKLVEYKELILEIERYLFENNNDDLDKEKVIIELADVLRNHFRTEINQLPISIQKLYSSHYTFNNMGILFDNIKDVEFCAYKPYEDILYDFLEYIHNEQNETYIHFCYTNIRNFFQQLSDYLEKEDKNHNKYKNMVNIDLFNYLNEKLKDLNVLVKK